MTAIAPLALRTGFWCNATQHIYRAGGRWPTPLLDPLAGLAQATDPGPIAGWLLAQVDELIGADVENRSAALRKLIRRGLESGRWRGWSAMSRHDILDVPAKTLDYVREQTTAS